MSHATVCLDTHLDRDVLIKELQQGVDQRRILDEVAALTSIRSKHVVQIYDVIKDSTGAVIGLVEEYIPGNDLVDFIPITDANLFLRIAYAIACGISDIHTAGRVHRDIKPNNIKFDREGCLKIFDFGLAREGQVDAATQGAVGTPGFMAPELWVDDDEVIEFTEAIDVYAFGATMLALALRRLPRPLRQVPPQLPSTEADFAATSLSLPIEISSSMNVCIAQDPTNRPRMSAVRDVIGEYLLRDQHRATLVVNGNVHVLDSGRRGVTITLPHGVAQLRYDGLRFSLTTQSGDVFVNNVPVAGTLRLPKSCVVTFGQPHLGMNRIHVPVDVSHPEVVL
ncbi:protein kinase [Phyllobacterium sp. CCNWLW109]|uniref:protein kinase domain-containing protein n=1 Tax=Phyllobacterium sp. CCNWLW109 TaxID=3127479 RepID=UPI003077A221